MPLTTVKLFLPLPIMKKLLLLLFSLPLSSTCYVLANPVHGGSSYWNTSEVLQHLLVDITRQQSSNIPTATTDYTGTPATDTTKQTEVQAQDTTLQVETLPDSTELLNPVIADTTKQRALFPSDTTKQAGVLNQDTTAVAEPEVTHIQPDTVVHEKELMKRTGKIWRTAEMDEAMVLYTSLKYQAAYKKFKEAGAIGDGAAFYMIGRMYQYGELRKKAVVPDSLEPTNPDQFFIQSNDSARYYYQLALQENNLIGNLGLAELTTVRNDDDKQRFLRLMRSAAVEIRERAVEGDAFCNRILGSMYYTGYGEMQDLEYAFRYLSKAAEKKDVASYVALANLYLSGEGVDKDKDKAVYWLQKGVEAGDKEAIYTLGLVYEEGLAGKVDTEEAKELYTEAIRKGSKIAFEQLKYMDQTLDQKLTIASFTRNSDMLKKTLAAGARINTRAVPEGYEVDFRNRTPLMHAVYIPVMLEDFGVIYEPEVRKQAISILLSNKADVNATDQDGKTALHYTLLGARIRTDFFELEQAEILDTLLRYGANPNVVDKQGNPPLFYALQATNGQHEMELGRLLAGGASPDIQNEEGITPLMLACKLKASNEVILSLLNAGANPKIRDRKGMAAIDYTTQETVRNILLAAGSPEAVAKK